MSEEAPNCPRCNSVRLNRYEWVCGTPGTVDNYGSTPACQLISRMRKVVEAAKAWHALFPPNGSAHGHYMPLFEAVGTFLEEDPNE